MEEDWLKKNKGLLEKGETITFYLEHPDLGKIQVYLNEVNKVAPNLYLAEARNFSEMSQKKSGKVKNICPYQALMTLDAEIVVNFNKMILKEYWCTEDEKEYYFNFEKKQDHKMIGLHVSKKENDKYELNTEMLNYSDYFWFEPIIGYGNYWILRSVDKFDIENLFLYDPKNKKVISNLYHEIDFEMGKKAGYTAFVRRFLYVDNPEDVDDYISLTSVFGFVDEKFLPATPFYETTANGDEAFLNTENIHSLEEMEKLMNNIKEMYFSKYMEKLKRANSALEYIMNNPNLKKQESSKVLSFVKRNK